MKISNLGFVSEEEMISQMQEKGCRHQVKSEMLASTHSQYTSPTQGLHHMVLNISVGPLM